MAYEIDFIGVSEKKPKRMQMRLLLDGKQKMALSVAFMMVVLKHMENVLLKY